MFPVFIGKVTPDMTAADVEAGYQVIRLVNEHPRLIGLLFKAQYEGADWVTLLEIIQQALVAGTEKAPNS